jgi:hypothetical protein
MVIGADSDAEKTGAILKVPPDHHWVVVVPTNSMAPPAATAWISPTPPSKKGAEGLYFVASIVAAEKSS